MSISVLTDPNSTIVVIAILFYAISYTALYVLLALLCGEVSIRYFRWWFRLSRRRRRKRKMEPLAPMMLGCCISGVALTIWICSLVGGGLEHRNIVPPIALVIDALLLVSLYFKLNSCWQLDAGIPPKRIPLCITYRIIIAYAIASVLYVYTPS